MANQGAKKRKEENARHMRMLLRIIIACNVVYVLVRMLIYCSTFTGKHWIGLALTSGTYYVPYSLLAKMARLSYMMMAGSFLMVDLIRVLVEFAGNKLFGFSRGFFSQGSEGAVEDEKTRKKREKMEKKASRTKFVTSSNR